MTGIIPWKQPLIETKNYLTKDELTEPGYYWWHPTEPIYQDHKTDPWNIIYFHPKWDDISYVGYFVGPLKLEKDCSEKNLAEELLKEIIKYYEEDRYNDDYGDVYLRNVETRFAKIIDDANKLIKKADEG